MLCILYYIIGFLLYSIIQAIFINGVHDSFKGGMLVDGNTKKVDYQGMVFYMIAPKFIENNKHKAWSKPIFSCVRCMASLYGALTYWPPVIYFFGFHWLEVYVFVINVFMLVYLNKYFYSKV